MTNIFKFVFNLKGQNAWSKTAEGIQKVLNVCSNLCNSSLKAYDESDSNNNAASVSQLSSARLTTQVTSHSI